MTTEVQPDPTVTDSPELAQLEVVMAKLQTIKTTNPDGTPRRPSEEEAAVLFEAMRLLLQSTSVVGPVLKQSLAEMKAIAEELDRERTTVETAVAQVHAEVREIAQSEARIAVRQALSAAVRSTFGS